MPTMRSCGEIYTAAVFTRTPFGFKNVERRCKPQDLLYGKLETPPICRQPFHRWYFFSFRNLDDCKKYISLTVLNRTIIIIVTFITN